MDDYEKFEAECEKRKNENHTFIIGFTRYLENKKLSQKTITKHVGNIDFYINDFLLYESPQEAAEGVTELNYFLGYWFIKKAMWASPTSIKENIASLKHFYSYMNKIGQVSAEELDEMKAEIKERKDDWIETVQRYDDLNIDMDDVWG
ncbi:Recombinase [Candidatus Desulfarcum epimagneticum]|uniref:Recombinase n=1 Tax=uncultured Desulfobacteraceae bacterium TaxID=218296 RepID=A0A484HIE5_9BACT|nr:Recombinase [uncultured Desulfobacteraceae bacterium]